MSQNPGNAWPSHLHLSVDGSTLWGATVWPPGKRFYGLARQVSRSAAVHRQGTVSVLAIVLKGLISPAAVAEGLAVEGSDCSAVLPRPVENNLRGKWQKRQAI